MLGGQDVLLKKRSFGIRHHSEVPTHTYTAGKQPPTRCVKLRSNGRLMPNQETSSTRTTIINHQITSTDITLAINSPPLTNDPLTIATYRHHSPPAQRSKTLHTPAATWFARCGSKSSCFRVPSRRRTYFPVSWRLMTVAYGAQGDGRSR